MVTRHPPQLERTLGLQEKQTKREIRGTPKKGTHRQIKSLQNNLEKDPR
jgi:hypothetical protein